MGKLVRFGVSMDERLLKTLDKVVERRGYPTRSEAIRDWQKGEGTVVGTLTLIYDHHVRELNEHLVNLQHEHQKIVYSTMHVHLSHRMCLEVIVLRGRPRQIQRLADRLIAARGVKHGRLVATSGEDLV